MYRPSPLFPVPLIIHLIYVAVSAIVLLLGYKYKKQLYQLTLLVAIVSTLLVYFVEAGISFYILAIEETALFVWTTVLIVMNDVREAKKEKEAALARKENGEIENSTS